MSATLDRSQHKTWEEQLWEKAKEYASCKAAQMYPPGERRDKYESRAAHEEYLRLRYP